MGAHHTHRSSKYRHLSAGRRNTLIAFAVLWTAVCLIGLVTLRPGATNVDTSGVFGEPTDAQVVERRLETCGETQCVNVVIDTGDNRFELGPYSTKSALGRQNVGADIIVSETANGQWYFVDVDRRTSLWALAAVFAACVVLLGRRKGLASLASLASTMAVLVAFIAPGVLAGHNPVLVCAVGAVMITLITAVLTHGFGPLSAISATSTVLCVLCALVVGEVFTRFAQITGMLGEQPAVIIASGGADINFAGLYLGGIILGALGAIDDITITQASTVAELYDNNATLTPREVFSSAMRVGRDHIGAAVNTLALAYAGSSLPLVIMFAAADQRLDHIFNSEIVATEIVRTLSGSVGLVAAVPLTTALCAAILHQQRLDER